MYPTGDNVYIPSTDLQWVQVFDVLDMSGKPLRTGPWPTWVAVPRPSPELPERDLEQVTAGGLKATMATLDNLRRG